MGRNAIHWSTKGKGITTSFDRYDVRVSVNKNGENRRSVRIGFSKEAADKVLTTPYINAGVTNERIYFRPSDEQHGYKVQLSKKSGRYFEFKLDDGRYEELVGEYKLKYDATWKMSYVEKGAQ